MSRGPSKKTRELVWQRDDGCCVVCRRSVHTGVASVHHRRARAMGGSRDAVTNSPVNLILVCGSGTTGCHGWIEADPGKARANGWRVNQAQDPREVPVWHHGRWVLLDEFGGLEQMEVHRGDS